MGKRAIFTENSGSFQVHPPSERRPSPDSFNLFYSSSRSGSNLIYLLTISNNGERVLCVNILVPLEDSEMRPETPFVPAVACQHRN